MVQTIDELEADGRVARRRNPTDRRAYDVTITPEGKRVLARANAALQRCELEFVKDLTPSERETLMALLVRLPHKPLVFDHERP
jgi:DNA-binding MarR family transcriptional regulator